MRSVLAALAAPLLAVGVLAGCSTTNGTTTVSLAGAQAESGAILTALEAGASVYTSAPSTIPAQAAQVQNIMSIATTAVGAFQGNGATETPAQLAEAASQDIIAVLAVLPIDPVTKTAIDAGLAVIDGFVAGTFTSPAAPVATLGVRERVAPPVPIPTPHRLPPTV
ncbi:MAG: hypothetical protein ACREFP_04090 [Acetobacteraceae bacterium]